jgi:preprotein translocase subunit SecG
MVTLLTILFVILCFLLGIAILIQQGKGDMGLGGLGGGSQLLFGGSGGQEFFEKITWTMGALFILGALGLSILKYKATDISRIKVTPVSQVQQKQIPTQKPIDEIEPIAPVKEKS